MDAMKRRAAEHLRGLTVIGSAAHERAERQRLRELVQSPEYQSDAEFRLQVDAEFERHYRRWPNADTCPPSFDEDRRPFEHIDPNNGPEGHQE
jgi:hypothetical protein